VPWVVSATLLKWRCIGPGDKSEQRATATCPVNHGPSTRITLPERTYGTGERVDLTKLRTVVDVPGRLPAGEHRPADFCYQIKAKAANGSAHH
jgi:hypothetical protein